MRPSDPEADTLSALLAIFYITNKAQLIEHCGAATIESRDLANLIMACQAWTIPIGHIPIFKHHHPAHLELTEEDRRAMASAKVGPLVGPAKKSFRKVGQMFKERRLFCGHMFWPRGVYHAWHLIYFDQRDVSLSQSHWRDGSHIHLMNMITHPQVRPRQVAPLNSLIPKN